MIRAKRSRKLARAVSLWSKSTETDSASMLCVWAISVGPPNVLVDNSQSLQSAGRAIRGGRGGLDTVLGKKAVVKPCWGTSKEPHAPSSKLSPSL